MLCVACCLLSVSCSVSFGIWYLLVVGYVFCLCALFVMCYSVSVMCYLLSVMCSLFFSICYLSIVGDLYFSLRYLVLVICELLYVVC